MAVVWIELDNDVQLTALNSGHKDYNKGINKGFRPSAPLHTLANMADYKVVGPHAAGADVTSWAAQHINHYVQMRVAEVDTLMTF